MDINQQIVVCYVCLLVIQVVSWILVVVCVVWVEWVFEEFFGLVVDDGVWLCCFIGFVQFFEVCWL